jgi:hypothetical protein
MSSVSRSKGASSSRVGARVALTESVRPQPAPLAPTKASQAAEGKKVESVSNARRETLRAGRPVADLLGLTQGGYRFVDG